MKAIRFYCEHCGNTVRPRDKICPTCGSFFAEVRCPVCTFQGDVKEFMHGCPACGYAGDEVNPHVGYEVIDIGPEEPSGHRARRRSKGRGRIPQAPAHLPLVVAGILGSLTFAALVWYYIFVIRGYV